MERRSITDFDKITAQEPLMRADETEATRPVQLVEVQVQGNSKEDAPQSSHKPGFALDWSSWKKIRVLFIVGSIGFLGPMSSTMVVSFSMFGSKSQTVGHDKIVMGHSPNSFCP